MNASICHILELFGITGFLVQTGEEAEFWADAEQNRKWTPGHRSLRQRRP